MLCSKNIKYCKCGCEEILTSKSYKKKGILIISEYNNGHYWKGKTLSKEHKEKISFSESGEKHYNFKDGRTLKKYYCLDCGKELKKVGAKYCEIHATKHRDNEWKKKISLSLKGNIPFNKGLNKYNNEAIFRQSLKMIEILNPNYIDGRSHILYPKEFNNELKKKIRLRDYFKCQLCGIEENKSKELYKRKLALHHIDYNKRNCEEDNLITVCIKCNAYLNKNRDYWAFYFSKLNIYLDSLSI